MNTDEDHNKSRRAVKRKKEKKSSHSKKKSKKKHYKKRDRSTSSSSGDSNRAPSIETRNVVKFDVDGNYCVEEAIDLAKGKLREILRSEPALTDLPLDVSLEEVRSLIALEKGQAMDLELVRGDGSVLNIIVPIDATVGQLKRQVEQATVLKLRREGQHHRSNLKCPINWKYVWQTYWLFVHGTKLKNDQASLSDCGINNRDRITFIKRLKEK